MDEALEYTTDAELNRYLFYSDLNEISFFVEDKDKEYEYETIFKRRLHLTTGTMFGDEYRIAAIISANGKPGVINAFDIYGETNPENPLHQNFYIVDGDFDRYIHQEEMVCNSHFIYLERYNIESYFIDENATLTFAKGKLHKMDEEVKRIVEFSLWRSNIVRQASRLFILYCAVQKVIPTEQNVARNEYLFIDDKTGFERKDGYDMYYNQIAQKKIDIDKDVKNMKEIYEKFHGNNYFDLICGKFLLISLYVYLRGKIKEKFNKDDLRWHLIREFDITSLNFVKEKVNFVCNTSKV